MLFIIRHWEVTARVQKAFLSFFSSCFDFFDLFADLARACLGFLERPSTLVRGRASTYGLHNRTAASLDARRPGPDLTWQRKLAAVVCAALEGVFKGRK